MYKIFADDTLIYDSTLEDYKIGKGNIDLETNKSLLEIGADVEKISHGDKLRVDTLTGTIENLTTGDVFHAQPLPGFVQEIADAGGLINYTKNKK